MKKLLTLVLAFISSFCIGNRSMAEDISDDGTVAYARCSSGYIYIRDTYDVSGNKVGYLYNDDEVYVIGTKNGWTHIRVEIEEGHGWVKSEYISSVRSSACESISGEYRNSSGGRMRIRKSIDNKTDCVWLDAEATIHISSVTTDTNGCDWGKTKNGWVMMSCMTQVR